MNYQEALSYLDAHIGAGVKPGLDRIRLLAETMGSPHLDCPVIHVAGTNGKTSTTRMAALLLVAHGLSTGTYTSPHLEKVQERIGFNGRDADETELALAVSDVAAFADILESRGESAFTYFELTTAMAFAFFAEKAVEAAVVEVGLGGRLDATNIVEAEVAVVTSVGLDHTEYLGDTIAQIADEKLAIAKPGSILVTGPLPAEALARAEAVARDREIEHRAYGRDFSAEARQAVGGWLVDIHGTEDVYSDVLLGVHGRHQTVNAAVAAAATEALLGRALDGEAVLEAGAAFTTPGRMEAIGADPVVLLDGAHNAEGFAALEPSLAEEFPTTRWVLVLGVMGDKDVEAMIDVIKDRVTAVVVTQAASERAVPVADLADRIGRRVDIPIQTQADPSAAISVARDLVGDGEGVLVAGSLYLVGEVRTALGASG